MKRNLVVPLLLAVVLGVAIGFFIRGQFTGRQKLLATAVLHDLSFAEFIANVGSSDWHVVEDKMYDTFPPLSRSPRIARRIVAQTTLPDSEHNAFATRFQVAAEEWITSHGAVIKGEHEANRTSAEAVADGQLLTLVDLPRRYYAINNMNGVADFGGCISELRVNLGQMI